MLILYYMPGLIYDVGMAAEESSPGKAMFFS